jgi:RNA polymerase sigma-70 factor, ECF subfamily
MEAGTFHDLYAAHAPDVYRFALWLTGSVAEAEDILSETFLRAWAGRANLRMATARGYLISIARNLVRDEKRRRARQASLPEGFDPGVAALAPVHVELSQTLELLEKLPDALREPLVAMATGLSQEETARLLGISLANVKIRVHRARLRLADLRREGRVNDERTVR